MHLRKELYQWQRVTHSGSEAVKRRPVWWGHTDPLPSRMTASEPAHGEGKDVSENSNSDRGPVYAEYRLGEETHEVPDPTWAVMPDDGYVWLDLIGYDTGEWSVKLTPQQSHRIAEALENAAGSEGA